MDVMLLLMSLVCLDPSSDVPSYITDGNHHIIEYSDIDLDNLFNNVDEEEEINYVQGE